MSKSAPCVLVMSSNVKHSKVWKLPSKKLCFCVTSYDDILRADPCMNSLSTVIENASTCTFMDLFKTCRQGFLGSGLFEVFKNYWCKVPCGPYDLFYEIVQNVYTSDFHAQSAYFITSIRC